MEKVGSSLAEYRKTFVAAILGFVTILANSLIQTGDITAEDWRIAIGAAILAATGVWGIPNKNVIKDNVEALKRRYEERVTITGQSPVISTDTVVEDLKSTTDVKK